MDTWLIVLVVVIGIVVRILSASAKKKAKEQAKQNASETEAVPAPPPRTSTMSDIQRAFMAMSGIEDEPVKKQAPPPIAVPFTPASTNVYEGSAGDALRTSSSQGLAGRTEGIGSYEGAFSSQGLAGKTEGIEFHAPGTHNMIDRRLDELTTLSSGLKESYTDKYAAASTSKLKKNPLHLFENKDDFTKAVIYSEILSRRTR